MFGVSPRDAEHDRDDDDDDDDHDGEKCCSGWCTAALCSEKCPTVTMMSIVVAALAHADSLTLNFNNIL